MEERELFALVRTSLLAVLPLTTPTIAGVDVIRAFQSGTPTMPSGPAVTLQFLPDVRYGWVKRETYPDPDEDAGMVLRETQAYETTLQCQGLWRQPVGTPGRTVRDLTNLAAAIVQGDAFMGRLQALGVGVLRVTTVRELNFVNDQGDYEQAPSFDFTLTHEQVTLTKVPEITGTEYRQYPV